MVFERSALCSLPAISSVAPTTSQRHQLHWQQVGQEQHRHRHWQQQVGQEQASQQHSPHQHHPAFCGRRSSSVVISSNCDLRFEGRGGDCSCSFCSCW